MRAFDIYSLTRYPALSEVAIWALVIGHLALLCASIATILVATWSLFNHPQWTLKSYFAVICSVVYLVVTFVALR